MDFILIFFGPLALLLLVTEKKIVNFFNKICTFKK